MHRPTLRLLPPSASASQYAVIWRRRGIFNVCCKLAMLMSTVAPILGVVLVWLLYPRSYNYQNASSPPALLRCVAAAPAAASVLCGCCCRYRRCCAGWLLSPTVWHGRLPAPGSGLEGQGLVGPRVDFPPSLHPPVGVQMLGSVMTYFDTQRVGTLPIPYPIPWRGDTFLAGEARGQGGKRWVGCGALR